TGHGPGPAMVTAAVAAAFRVQSADSSKNPIARFEAVNREVRTVARGKYQMMLSAIELNADTGVFKFYSAGGLPVFALHRSGKAKAYAACGTPLGTPKLEIGTTEGRLNPEERLLVMTDGLPEIEVPGGKQL